MDTSRIDLNLLVTLEALLTEQNVTRAAARLHLSQPAVSAQLNRLRDLFGDPLLLPARRGMTPTAKALELVEPLRKALDQVRSTLQAPWTFDPQSAALTVTAAGSDYAQAAIIMPLLPTLRRKAPGVRLAVRYLDPARMGEDLADGAIDLAIAQPDLGLPHLRTCSLFDETYVLIGRRDHPRLRAELTIEDYVQLDHIVVSRRGSQFATPVDETIAALGYRRNVVMSAASFLLVPEVVAVSDLVALVPRRLLPQPPDQLTLLDLPWLSEQFNMSLIWHERSHGHPGHRWLRELILEQIANPGARQEERPGAQP